MRIQSRTDGGVEFVIFVLILNGNTVNATDNNLSFVFALHVLNSGVCAVDLKCLNVITFLC